MYIKNFKQILKKHLLSKYENQLTTIDYNQKN